MKLHANLTVSRIALLALMATLAAALGCAAPPDKETMALLRKADEAFKTAQTTGQTNDQYVASAQVIEQLVDTGFVSGLALYNQGNAYAQAGQVGRAIAAYRQALRYKPRNAELHANLESVLEAPIDQKTMRVVDHLFVWQRWLSYREKYQLTTLFLIASLTMFWVARWTTSSYAWRRFGIAAAVAFLVMASSTLIDWYRYEKTLYGVVTREVVSRKGNSETYDPAFTRPMVDGTEFTVRQQRGDWIRARFADNVEAWLPTNACVVY